MHKRWFRVYGQGHDIEVYSVGANNAVREVTGLDIDSVWYCCYEMDQSIRFDTPNGPMWAKALSI